MGNRVVGVLQSNITLVQGVCVPDGTLKMLSVLGKFFAGKRVSMYFLHVYLVSQVM